MDEINTSWDSTWEKIFQSREWGKYPAIELVRFVAKNYYSVENRSKVKILDLGCGTGASTWYLAREGFAAYGIDGSSTAIEKAKTRLERKSLKATLLVGDFLNIPFPDNFFDCIIDIGSIQHNSYTDVKTIIGKQYQKLMKGGKFFGMMVAEDKSIEKGYGEVHFFSKLDIKEIFKQFRDLRIGHVLSVEEENGTIDKRWLVEGTK